MLTFPPVNYHALNPVIQPNQSSTSEFRFNLQNRFGLFTLELHILPTGLGVDRGILLTIPQNSIDLNPPDSVPEPSARVLTLTGLAVLALRRKQR